MTWIKLDHAFSENPKVIGLSGNAVRLDIFAMCYAARNETDGKVPATALAALRGKPKDAEELIAAGRWHKNGTGWIIHDYLKYNPSAKQMEERRIARRQIKGRRRGIKRQRIIDRDGMVCRLCRRAIRRKRDLHIDHIVPVALGGASTPDNLQVSHAKCNQRKGARPWPG